MWYLWFKKNRYSLAMQKCDHLKFRKKRPIPTMPTGRSKLMYRNWVTEWCSYLMDGHMSSMSPKKVKGPRVARASAGDNVPIFPSLSIGVTWKFAQSSHRVVRLRSMGLSYLIISHKIMLQVSHPEKNLTLPSSYLPWYWTNWRANPEIRWSKPI